jgi:hypothetical protein
MVSVTDWVPLTVTLYKKAKVLVTMMVLLVVTEAKMVSMVVCTRVVVGVLTVAVVVREMERVLNKVSGTITDAVVGTGMKLVAGVVMVEK